MAKYNEVVAPNKSLEFIHVSLDEDAKTALEWAKQESFPWLHVLPRKQKRSNLGRFHTSGSVPFYCMIDKDGKVLAKGSNSVFAKAKELAQ